MQRELNVVTEYSVTKYLKVTKNILEKRDFSKRKQSLALQFTRSHHFYFTDIKAYQGQGNL